VILRFALLVSVLSLSTACSSSSSSRGGFAGDASVSDSSTQNDGSGGQPANDATTELDAGDDAAVSSVTIANAVLWQTDPSNGNWPSITGHLVNDSASLLVSVDEIQAWFEGGTPRAFPSVNPYEDLFGQPNGGIDSFTFWFLHGTTPPNEGNAAVMGSFNSSGAMSVNASDGPMEPYSVGTLHFVMKGKLQDGTTWQASADYAPSP
jgi:hypothetical protein